MTNGSGAHKGGGKIRCLFRGFPLFSAAHEVRLMIPFAIIPTPARAALSARQLPLALALLLLSRP
jgi:hypothetical protein